MDWKHVLHHKPFASSIDDFIEPIQTFQCTPARQSIETLEHCVFFSPYIKSLQVLDISTKRTWDVTWETWGCWSLTSKNFLATPWFRRITWYIFKMSFGVGSFLEIPSDIPNCKSKSFLVSVFYGRVEYAYFHEGKTHFLNQYFYLVQDKFTYEAKLRVFSESSGIFLFLSCFKHKSDNTLWG